MTIGNGKTTPVETVHVKRCLSRGLSEDGTQGVISFEADSGGMFVLRIDAADLAAAQEGITAAHNELCRRRNSFTLSQVKLFGVLEDTLHRNHTLLAIHPQQPLQAVYSWPDAIALDMAQQMEAKALSHMTPEQRAKAMRKPLMNSSGLIVPR